MRYLIVILICFFASCSQGKDSNNEPGLKNVYWVSKYFEYYEIDSSVGNEKLFYSSALLLKLDSNKKVNFLSSNFYWNNDSLYLGSEPGRIMKSGSWELKDNEIVLHQNLLYKERMLTGDSVGQPESDTLKLEGDSLLIYKNDTLIPLTKPSQGLLNMMNKEWTNLFNKDN